MMRQDCWIRVNKMSEEKLEKILSTLEEISKWTKFQGLEKFKDTINKVLKTDEERVTYELSNGINSSRDIAKQINVGKSTVILNWKRWQKIGIVEESEKYPGRMRHLATLDEIGIELPPILQKKENKKEEEK